MNPFKACRTVPYGYYYGNVTSISTGIQFKKGCEGKEGGDMRELRENLLRLGCAVDRFSRFLYCLKSYIFLVNASSASQSRIYGKAGPSPSPDAIHCPGYRPKPGNEFVPGAPVVPGNVTFCANARGEKFSWGS